MRKRYWVPLGLIGGVFVRSFFSSGIVEHVSHTDQNNSTSGLLFLTEDTNVEEVRNLSKLRELLSKAEYRQAQDTTQFFAKNYQDPNGRAWRAKSYRIFNDSLLVEARFTAKLILVNDNNLGGGRQYFFQIRTYDKHSQLIDQADFASWSDAKKEHCSGWLTDDYFLIRSCDSGGEIKRINQSGRFIIPSPRTVTWLKLRGY